MRKQIQISVADPCQQDWNTMHPNGNGRFCDQCSKTVIDFSTMSDAEVYRLLSKKSNNVCGRFRDEQLERSIEQPVSQTKKTFWAVLMTGLLAFVSNVSRSQNRSAEKAIQKTNSEQVVTVGELMVTAYMPQILVEDEEGKPLEGVTVYISGSIKRITTDSSGYFQFPSKYFTRNAEISMVGFESVSVTLFKSLEKITLKRKEVALNPITVSTALKGSMGSIRVGGAFVTAVKRGSRSKSSPVPAAPLQISSPVVFPNPVRVGQMLRVQCEKQGQAIDLMTANGQVVLSRNAMITKDLDVSFQVPSHLSAGLYYLRFTDKTGGKSSVKSLLIAQ